MNDSSRTVRLGRPGWVTRFSIRTLSVFATAYLLPGVELGGVYYGDMGVLGSSRFECHHSAPAYPSDHSAHPIHFGLVSFGHQCPSGDASERLGRRLYRSWFLGRFAF